ncbi:MAG: hypothetical protein ACXVGH_12770, partial [Mycobacteriales bacterium]
VALVLLVIGLIDPSLGFVYASIAVSLASFAFLIVGILQRRKELPDGGQVPADASSSAAPDVAEGATVLPAVAPVVGAPAVADTPAEAPASADLQGQVLVVAGRPRYHVDGCRYLTGKQAESVEVADARADGFTACGVCKPDAALAATAAVPAAPVAAEPAVSVVDPLEEVDVVESVEVVPAPRVRAARKAPAVQRGTDPVPAVPAELPEPVAADPVVDAPVAEAPAVKAPKGKVAARPAAKAPAKAVKAAPVKAAPVKAAPVKTAPVKAAAAKPAAAKRPGVIVIPDRGKFHTPACRYVRGAEGTQELTRAAATKQGYQACGVCNP